jgi:hypothetical protein
MITLASHPSVNRPGLQGASEAPAPAPPRGYGRAVPYEAGARTREPIRGHREWPGRPSLRVALTVVAGWVDALSFVILARSSPTSCRATSCSSG